MPATIRDIKDRTGLSLATISKYLNGGNVLPENKIRIEAAIKELHYEVNEIARGLVTNRTKTVGVMVYSIESLFNGTLLKHVGDALRKEGYGMLICDSNGDEETEAKNLRFLLNKKVDGIIIVPVARDDKMLEPARNAQVPVVLIDRTFRGGNCDCVRIDNRAAAFRATKLLVEKNHRRIASISSATEYTGMERHAGYMDALNEAGIEICPEYIKKGLHSIEWGYESMKELLALPNKPTAVFMSNYEITLGAVMALNETEYSCPGDVSLLGFDDLILSHVTNPRMCMVVQPMKEMGERAVAVLMNKLSDKEEVYPVEIVLSTYLEEGNSVREI